ncbi:MAG: hypothetical protein JRJ85_05775 [Deltaproteobacteria bacterium]|nr:hypothetical protein [Deltaproteobacteria bacterium]
MIFVKNDLQLPGPFFSLHPLTPYQGGLSEIILIVADMSRNGLHICLQNGLLDFRLVQCLGAFEGTKRDFDNGISRT